MRSEKSTDIIYSLLYGKYGDLGWWPAETPDEVVIGAILTQNTSWNNVEKCIENLKRHALITLETLKSASINNIRELIRSSGFFNQKAERLKRIAMAIVDTYGSLEGMQSHTDHELAHFLGSLNGVGSETMESIMLYALSRPFFVMDKYTYRIFSRIGFPVASSREEIRERIAQDLCYNIERMKNYHAMLVYLGKDHCRTKPICDGCPLSEICDYYAASMVP